MNKRYKAMLHMLRIGSPMQRANWLREHHIFRHIGQRVMIMNRKVPLYPELISIGDNVWMASGVQFITHDVTHFMLNGLDENVRYQEKIGCIEVGNNVFIGADTSVLYDVRIGSNVIIAAGSVVTKDIPDNTVFGGVPARFICSFDEYFEKRKTFHMEHTADNAHACVSPECVEEAWSSFYQKRNK